jgi:hypothetical protein
VAKEGGVTEPTGSGGGGPGSDASPSRAAGTGAERARSVARCDGERSGVQPHHRGGPGPRQGRPGRLGRLLFTGAASVAPARPQEPAAGESAGGGRRASGGRPGVRGPGTRGLGTLPSGGSPVWVLRKRLFPHPSSFLSTWEGALPSAAAPFAGPSLPVEGPSKSRTPAWTSHMSLSSWPPLSPRVLLLRPLGAFCLSSLAFAVFLVPAH